MTEGPQECVRIVAQILAGERAGQQALFEIYGPSLRFYLTHHLQAQADIEDKVHDTFVAVVTAIREGRLRDPARLTGFVHTIARRQVTGHIADSVRRRAESAGNVDLGQSTLNPEQELIERQQIQQVAQILRSMPELDREILMRFYFDDEQPEEICRELGLTETQFRLRKSRAKERFAGLKRRAEKKVRLPGRFLLRKNATSPH